MRAETRARMRELWRPGIDDEQCVTGVTGVTAGVTQAHHPSPHHLSHLETASKSLDLQGVTRATPVTREIAQVGGDCHTLLRVTPGRNIEGVTAAPDREWIDHFEERAAIREYEGGFDRAEAERLAREELAINGGSP